MPSQSQIFAAFSQILHCPPFCLFEMRAREDYGYFAAESR